MWLHEEQSSSRSSLESECFVKVDKKELIWPMSSFFWGFNPKCKSDGWAGGWRTTKKLAIREYIYTAVYRLSSSFVYGSFTRKMLLTEIWSIATSCVRFLVLQLCGLFGRANQLSFGNSNREPNDHDLLRSTKWYQKFMTNQYSRTFLLIYSIENYHF